MPSYLQQKDDAAVLTAKISAENLQKLTDFPQQINKIKQKNRDLNTDYQFFTRGNIAILRFKKYKAIYLQNVAHKIA
ncbi:hypothetical protein CHX27_02720 [Flavobacterium aurantiibacter]|uniref:Uncharacterized protein n=1 Tax=Flavobacterium aurantiibacter TaxID=2023067 RepID=A0A256A2P7_9FLAO|nr:hypothetical protein CHX27_02720 [Flavobacterium aurantiibacter]